MPLPVNGNSIDLPRQFLLSRSSDSIPGGWDRHVLGEFHLATHPDLPVRIMYDPDRTPWGWLLGNPVANNGTLNAASPGAPYEENFETALYELGGAWTCIVATGEQPRLYLDSCGSRGVVYSPARQQAASSTALFGDAPYDDDLAECMDIPRRNRWYPFGLTPRKGCRRLLPNHVLDLKTWKGVRIWPREELRSVSVEESVEGIAAQVTKTISAFAPLLPYISITAGRDSRMLLACARPVSDALSCFTIATDTNKLDAQVGEHIARRFGLKHETYQREESTPDDLANWQSRVDYCVAGPTWKNVRTLARLNRRRPYLLGMAGEVVRAYYWQKSDRESTQLTPTDLVRRLRMPDNPVIENAANDWLTSLPAMNSYHVLDLLYLEQRVGCWASPQNEGHAESAFRIFPLAHRKTMELMFGLPVEYRRRGHLAHDLIRRTWPELLELPFNRPLGVVHRANARMQLGMRWARRRIQSPNHLSS